MIEWLTRRPGSWPFLVSDGLVWTYADTLAEVESRLVDEPVVVRPRLTPDSVFDLLAGVAGGGVTALSPIASATGDKGPQRLVVFTSGTTGSPKGVRLTKPNIEAACRASESHLGHGTDDRWLLAMPLHHVGGLSILLRSAYSGGSVELLASFDVEKVAAAMRGEVTMVSLVPTMLSRLLDHHPGPYKGLRAVLVGGGPIPDGLLDRAADAGIPVLPTYGMTETFGQIATLRPGSPVERKVHPLPGIELRIEDDGRISVAGDQVSPGYAGEPDRTDRWLVTNDLGVLDDEGALRVLGRSDDVIVTGGENVHPARVEAEVLALSGVEDVVVVGVSDAEWGVAVACVYAGAVHREQLEDWLGTRLPGHMVPKRWVHVNEVPRNEMGKPDRAAALAMVLGGDRR